jgi:hypothetical protein
MSEGAVGGENAAVATEAAEGATTEATTPEATPQPTSWRDSLGDDLRANPSLGKFDSVPALAKSYVELQKKIGAKGVIVPGADAGEVEWNEYYNELGRPDSAEGYELDKVEIPENLPWSEETLGLVAAEMHNLGISKSAAQGLVEKYIEIQSQQFNGQMQQIAQARETAIVELKKEWGPAYDAKMDLANRAFLTGAAEDEEKIRNKVMADGTKLGDDPDFVKVFANLGDKFSESGLIGDKVRRVTSTPDEAKREIRKLWADKVFQEAYQDAEHPEHEDAVERMNAAYHLAIPEEE